MIAFTETPRTEFTEGRTDEIMTYAGIVFRPLEPEPELILLEDIAHALSNSCRFTGHVREFYSVAEHSVRCSELLEDENFSIEEQFNGLMHDASEAYLSDIARPVKRQPGFGEMYDEVEERLMQAVAARFGIEWPMTKSVHWADNILLRAEQRDLMKGEYPLDEVTEFYPETIYPWAPDTAKAEFTRRYEDVVGRLLGQ